MAATIEDLAILTHKSLTLWLLNVAMEMAHLWMIYDDLPIKNGDFP